MPRPKQTTTSVFAAGAVTFNPRSGTVDLSQSRDRMITRGQYKGSPAIIIILPDNLTKISAQGFADCKNLSQITIPDSIQEIAKDAFAGTNVTIYCSQATYERMFAGKEDQFDGVNAFTVNGPASQPG